VTPKQRRPLTRDRVLRAAMKLADAGGFESLSMRNVAKELGVEAMSLYNHVASKDDLIDGMVDVVFGEIEVPDGGDWKEATRQRAASVREALSRHRWANGLMESRMNPGPANLRHHDATMGCLREAGFDFRDAVHAASVLDAYIYGFALQETSLPFDTAEEHQQVIETKQRQVPDMSEYPYLVEVGTEMAKAGYDYTTEFEFGLELILEGLERYRRQVTASRAGGS
jgi:AcrR family transcriptional regulator